MKWNPILTNKIATGDIYIYIYFSNNLMALFLCGITQLYFLLHKPKNILLLIWGILGLAFYQSTHSSWFIPPFNCVFILIQRPQSTHASSPLVCVPMSARLYYCTERRDTLGLGICDTTWPFELITINLWLHFRDQYTSKYISNRTLTHDCDVALLNVLHIIYTWRHPMVLPDVILRA